MSLYFRVFFLIQLVLILDSCKIQKHGAASKPSVPTVTIKPETKVAEPNYPYHSSQTLQNDLIHTTLEVSFDWQKQYLNGTATLIIKPYFYPQDSLILDAKGMDLHEVKLLNGKELKYSYDKKKIKIKLDKAYSRKDTFSVRIKYTAKPNELSKGGGEAIMSDIGLYFINPLGKEDKPKQIWTQGETESASCWFPTIDTPNEKTTQEMFITTDTSYSVLSNGKFIGSKNSSNGTYTSHWKQDLPHSPYLFMMAIGKYSIVKDKWNDLEVNYYVEPAYEKYAKDIFGHTPEMINFFSNKLNYKFPWAKYSQVVVRDYVSGAMENTTATVFMEALQENDRALADKNWDFIIAHELFHHWFGDLVTCESWANLPLNESFANYSEYLWAEYKYGVDEADHHAEEEGAEYFEEAKRKQVPLIRYHYKDRDDMFDRHSYNKGGRILHMLRKYVGDEAFFESLHLYLSRNQFKPAEIHNLRLAFEEVTGEDMNWFFDQWFLSSGYPQLEVSHHYSNGNLELLVRQVQDTVNTPIYKLPVKVDIWVNGIKTTYPVTITKAEEVFNFHLPAPPNSVIFDSEFQLLGKVQHNKSQEEQVFQYKNYNNRYLPRYQALSEMFQPAILMESSTAKLSMPFENPQTRAMLSAALVDSFWAVRNMALDQFSYYPVPGLQSDLPKIEQIALTDKKTSVRAKAISLISSLNNKEHVSIYIKAMNEKSYAVASAGLAAYLKSGDQSVKINFDEWESINNINVILTLANYYVSSATKGKYDWFLVKFSKGAPRVVYNLMEPFKNYILQVEKGKLEDAKMLLEDISKNNQYEPIRSMAKIILEDLEEKSGE